MVVLDVRSSGAGAASTTSPLQMLSNVVRHLASARLLIIATHRPTPPDRSEPVVSTISDLDHDPGVHRIDLSGLKTLDVTELLRHEARLTADQAKPLVSQLRDETGGNPFLLGSPMTWRARPSWT